MATAFFSSLENGETLEVAFSKPEGDEVTLRLLVDSGFIGQSSFVLAETAQDLAQAPALSSQASGALHGAQKRIIVSCRVISLGFQISTIAILANLSSLVLPPEIQGLVGLRFLRQFRRWGAERGNNGWRFFLEHP